jgi:phospholipid-transporting ATPase
MYRKRMSVILETPEHDIVLFTKGADSVLLERMEMSKMIEETNKLLMKYAEVGYRTLLLGKRKIERAKYEAWSKKYLVNLFAR